MKAQNFFSYLLLQQIRWPVKNLLFVVMMAACSSLFAQHSIKIGTQFPSQYAVQYDYQFHPKWSANGQVGVLTEPYDQIILSLLQTLGVEKALVSVISNTFKFGTISQLGINHHFKKNYVGVTGSWMHLQAANASVASVESAFNTTVASYPFRPRQTTSGPVSLTLASDLYNVGALVGHRFTFKNPRIELHTEFSFAKVVGSTSTVESPQKSVETLSALVDQELKTTYLDYGYLPSINVYFVYKLGKIK
jgi:hypothetical protein